MRAPQTRQRPKDRQRTLCPEGAPWRAPTAFVKDDRKLCRIRIYP